MRLPLIALTALLTLASLSAQAALVWSETSSRGVPVVMWARGANINEAQAAAKAFGGDSITILQTCRQTGYYAYVGSTGQTQRGISCGYSTRQAAIYDARMQCEQEGGRCDLEKLGYDGGEALADNADKAGIPTELPGGTEQTGNIQARSRRMVDD